MPFRRRLLFSLLLLGLVIGPLVAAVAYSRAMASRGWQPALMVDGLDCSVGRTCRRREGPQEESDATGKVRTIRINSLGFRDREFPDGTEPPHLLVALFGDSVVFGTGVEDGETLPAQLEVLLGERLGVPVRVLNLGMPMNYLASYLENLRLHVAPLAPDALVFALQGLDVLEAADVNDMMFALRDSPLLEWLRTDDDGVHVVNEWLRTSTRMPWSRAARRERTLARLNETLDEAAANDVPVVLFEYWQSNQLSSETVRQAIAPRAPVVLVGDQTLDEYRNSPRCIQGDGHPTPEGHRAFALQLAAALEPGLRRRIERGLRPHPPAPTRPTVTEPALSP